MKKKPAAPVKKCMHAVLMSSINMIWYECQLSRIYCPDPKDKHCTEYKAGQEE